MFSFIEKDYIKNLAWRSIDSYFKNQKLLVINDSEVPTNKLKENRACFVTLAIEGELRGCIGRAEATQPLYLDIIENAAMAGFGDSRFEPLSKEELGKIEIEVSILSVPQLVGFTSPEDLLRKIHPGIDGVIIKRDRKGATYLPQVWEEILGKEDFLDSLCEKAGLSAGDWKKTGIELWTYQVEVIE